MKSILSIQDLALDTELSTRQMAGVRGGQGDQANGVSQSNVMASYVEKNIGNGSIFAGSGPVTIQADTHVDQHADNTNYANNFKGLFVLPGYQTKMLG